MDVTVGSSGYTPFLDATLIQMLADDAQLIALARQSREAILAAPTPASWWRRPLGRSTK